MYFTSIRTFQVDITKKKVANNLKNIFLQAVIFKLFHFSLSEENNR